MEREWGKRKRKEGEAIVTGSKRVKWQARKKVSVQPHVRNRIWETEPNECAVWIRNNIHIHIHIHININGRLLLLVTTASQVLLLMLLLLP